MSHSAVYRPHSEAPAVARFRPHAPFGAWADGPLRAQRFDFVSRGDFVPGVLYRPETVGSSAEESGLPLLVLLHDRGRSMESDELGCAAAWVRQGLAVATIDLPLHGLRASPKLSARLISGLDRLASGSALDPETRALVEEFCRQATSDVARCLDALCALPEIDASRVALLGFGVGGSVASYLLAHDARVTAAVFASTASHPTTNDLDPTQFVRRSTGATLLMLEADDDAAIAAGIRAFFDAAPEPKQYSRTARLQPQASRDANAQVWDFLRKALRL
jgi:dienelactone hydrolase